MLITTCTHCLARFRVAPQQLNAKQGQVRCGRCRKVFNGFEALERYPDDDTGSRLLAAREASLGRTASSEPIEALPLEESADEPWGPVSTPRDRVEPARVTAPPESPRIPTAPRAPRSVASVPAYELPAPPAKPARAWRFGVALLAFLLAGEIAFALRAPIAQRYPILRPWLESVCAAFGCAVAWAHDDALLKLEDSELLEIPGKPNQIALGARIRNLAPVAQEFPHLELTLTDLTGQAAVRRVIRPTDYLRRPVAIGEVLAAGGELAIQLRLETLQVKATGYELLLFYP